MERLRGRRMLLELTGRYGYKTLLLGNQARSRLLSIVDGSHCTRLMMIFDHSGHSQARLGRTAGEQERLPVGQSIAVIAGLSALSWAGLISVIVAIRAVL